MPTTPTQPEAAQAPPASTWMYSDPDDIFMSTLSPPSELDVPGTAPPGSDYTMSYGSQTLPTVDSVVMADATTNVDEEMASQSSWHFSDLDENRSDAGSEASELSALTELSDESDSTAVQTRRSTLRPRSAGRF